MRGSLKRPGAAVEGCEHDGEATSGHTGPGPGRRQSGVRYLPGRCEQPGGAAKSARPAATGGRGPGFSVQPASGRSLGPGWSSVGNERPTPNQRSRSMNRRWLAYPWACFAVRGTHASLAGRAPPGVREAPRMERRVPNVQLSTADERETLPETQEIAGQTAPGCPGLGPTGGGTCRTAARGQ